MGLSREGSWRMMMSDMTCDTAHLRYNGLELIANRCPPQQLGRLYCVSTVRRAGTHG